MIGIDTNVLVRFLTEDDPVQSPAAERFLMEQCSAANPGWIGVIVLCEIVWVLQRGYGYSRNDIAAVLAQILRTAELEIEDKECARRALKSFRNGSADYSDNLIAQRNGKAGAIETYTFDRNAAKLDGFNLLEP